MKLGKWDSEKDRGAYIIADVGSNHCGDEDQAVAHIRHAAEAGASCAKFQYFRASSIYPPKGSAKYLNTDESLHTILKRYELPDEWLPTLKNECNNLGIEFTATPFSLEAVDTLEPFVSFWKIASYESNWEELITKCWNTGLPVIISTGGCDEGDLERILLLLHRLDVTQEYRSAILHCTSAYPTPIDEINASVVQTMAKICWPFLVGLSDHTTHPWAAPVVSVQAGGRIIEKHLTLSKDIYSPDAKFALDPTEFKTMTKAIHDTWVAAGVQQKKIQACESELSQFKRTLYATENIPAGATLTEKNTVCLRNTGKPNPAPPQALGFRLRLPVDSGMMITTGDLE